MNELYETLLWRAGPPAATWPLHLARLQQGAARLGLPLPDEAMLRSELAAQVPPGLQRLRLVWSTAGLAVSCRTPTAADLTPPPAHLQLGPCWRDPTDPLTGCKHSGLQRDVDPRQIVRSVDGAWSETAIANLLAGLDDGTLVTPDASAAPLPGTTLAALRAAGVTITPRRLDGMTGLRWLVLLNAVRGASVVASVEGVPLQAPPDDLVALAVRLVQPAP